MNDLNVGLCDWLLNDDWPRRISVVGIVVVSLTSSRGCSCSYSSGYCSDSQGTQESVPVSAVVMMVTVVMVSEAVVVSKSVMMMVVVHVVLSLERSDL